MMLQNVARNVYTLALQTDPDDQNQRMTSIVRTAAAYSIRVCSRFLRDFPKVINEYLKKIRITFVEFGTWLDIRYMIITGDGDGQSIERIGNLDGK